MKFLVVEDDALSRKLMIAILEPYGQVDCGEDGEDGWQKFQEAARENSPYDLVCLDLMMPKMDGISILKNSRSVEKSEGYGKKAAKIIAISGLGDKKNIAGALENGCEAFLPKPIILDEFLEKLRELGLIKEE